MVKLHIRLIILASIAASIWWGFYVMAPPSVKPEHAHPTQFSAHRAYQHVQQIAQKPHPVGTEDHKKVRRYLINSLKDLGLSPDADSTTAVRAAGLTAANITNIKAFIKGREATRTIVLMAHYDSAFYSKGAADDAAGVAAILETIRAIKAGKKPTHNILILFTDGEELGLLGANHFIKTYPERNRLAVVINLEARGTSGRSFMFETNSDNNNLISLFAKSVNHPAANSLTYSIYKNLPNSTDFSVMKPYGIQGLNFGFIDNLVNYHTLQDSPEHLSLRSLQHQGEQVLSSVRNFANSDKKIEGKHNAIYFNSPFLYIVHYPSYFSPFITLLAGILLVTAFVKIFRDENFGCRFKELGIITAWIIAALVLTFALHYILAKWLYELNPQPAWLQQGELYQSSWYFWAFLSLNVALIPAILQWLTRKYHLPQTMLGIYLILFLICLTLVVYVRGAHYLLVWPLLFSLAGFLWIGRYYQWNPQFTPSLVPLLFMIIALFPALFFIGPYIKFLHIALTTRSIAAGMVLATILLFFSWPLLRIAIKGWESYFYTATILGASLLFTTGFTNSGFSEKQRKQNSLMYHYDVDKKQAYWLSKDLKPDEWTRQYLGRNPTDTTISDYMFYGNRRLLKKKTEVPAINPEPKVEILSDKQINNIRKLHLYVQADPQIRATISRISFNNNNRVLNLSVDGKKLFDRKNPVPNQARGFDRLLVFKDHRKGYYLTLSVENPERPLKIQVTFYKISFPKNIITPRKPTMMPKPFGFTNGISWRKTFEV